MAPEPTIKTESFKQAETTTIPVVAGQSFQVDSIGGTILLEGVENRENIHLEVTRYVRIQDSKNAQQALDTLRWSHEEEGNLLRIKTFTQGDQLALGVENYRVDLRIQYPLSMPLEVKNASGKTLIQRAEAPIVVSQQEGLIDITGAVAGVDLRNQSGDITIKSCDGILKAEAFNGTIRAKKPLGPLQLDNHSGKITIDTPQSSVYARNTGGDIRIIALNGVQGNFDVKTQDGNISMLIPPTSDALLVLNVNDGQLYSKYPVTGTVQKTTSTFQGRLNNATHRVVLETQNGDIELD